MWDPSTVPGCSRHLVTVSQKQRDPCSAASPLATWPTAWETPNARALCKLERTRPSLVHLDSHTSGLPSSFRIRLWRLPESRDFSWRNHAHLRFTKIRVLVVSLRIAPDLGLVSQWQDPCEQPQPSLHIPSPHFDLTFEPLSAPSCILAPQPDQRAPLPSPSTGVPLQTWLEVTSAHLTSYPNLERLQNAFSITQPGPPTFLAWLLAENILPRSHVPIPAILSPWANDSSTRKCLSCPQQHTRSPVISSSILSGGSMIS